MNGRRMFRGNAKGESGTRSRIGASVALFAVFVLCSSACLPHHAQADESSKPNVILIMADDVGMEGFGCYGGTSYQTPRIDQLAAEGIRYTHAYSQPLCTPTRLQLMTGRYNHRNWDCFGIMPPGEKTIGHWMKEAGYRTCISGKWQLQSYDPPDYPGAEKRRGTGMRAEDSGFDTYQLFHALHTEDKGSRYADPTFIRDGELFQGLKGQYGEDLNVDFIIDFLDQKSDEPFFVYYPMALPHWPMVPTPWSDDWSDESKRHEADKRYFPDMVRYMDMLVGRIIDAVDERGLADNTLILFYSDNGTHLTIQSQMGSVAVPGGKATPHQTGIRVPLVARWSGEIKPGVSRDLIDASDFFPTLMQLAGREIPASFQHDGVSFAGSFGVPRYPVADGAPRKTCFFWYDPRPGWDKDRFRRHIFALDYQYKLYTDGRFMEIDDLLPIERELDPEDLSDEATLARERLQVAIDRAMTGPISEGARREIK